MSNECKAVPADCRQRLAAEGKPYPRSSCASCGQLSPKWRECDSMLARPVPQPLALGGVSAGLDLQRVVTEALMGMIAAVTSTSPPANEPPPPFIQAGIDRAVSRISAHLAPLQAEIVRQAAQFKDWQASHHRNYVAVAEERDQLKAEIERLTDSLANHNSLSKVMNAWVAEKGQMPWATAIKTLAIITKMPDQERDQLLNMDDGSTERGALIEERDQIKAEIGRLKEESFEGLYNTAIDERDQIKARCDEQAKALATLISVARTVNRNAASEARVPGDDEPQYRQRKEWIEYLLETCAEAEFLSKPAGSEPVEYGPTPGCKQCQEAEDCGLTDCPECNAQLCEDVNGDGVRPAGSEQV